MELFQSGIVDVLLSGQDHYYIFQDNGKSLWMDSGEDAEKVGVVDVHMKSYMKSGKKRFSWEADMRFVDTKNIPEDATIASKVKGYDKFLSKELDIEIGKTLSELLKNSVSGTGVHVFIGADNKLFDYSGCSMILAPIKAKSTINKTKTLGAIGVIGPMRVNYGRIIPMVDFTAQAISKLFK